MTQTITTLPMTLRNIVAKRIAYRRTLAELKAMSLNVAQDLGIYQGDARKIAHRAVYGA